MPAGALQTQLTWAEDRAPVRTDPSADPGAKTEGRAVTHTSAAPPSSPLRDWHQSAKPSRHDAAKSQARRLTQLANNQRSTFHFPVNQDKGT